MIVPMDNRTSIRLLDKRAPVSIINFADVNGECKSFFDSLQFHIRAYNFQAALVPPFTSANENGLGASAAIALRALAVSEGTS